MSFDASKWTSKTSIMLFEVQTNHWLEVNLFEKAKWHYKQNKKIIWCLHGLEQKHIKALSIAG